MSHEFALRVYYEDTDLSGIVYYANYLKFIERGRTEAVRAAGVDQNALRDEHCMVFAVRRIEADYLSPARFDDELLVSTRLEKLRGASLDLHQTIRCSGVLLFEARLRLAAITLKGKPARLPADIRHRLKLIGA